jgi:hypothetical protein
MSRAKKISGRFPHFYKYWESDSSIFTFTEATGKRLDEIEKEFVSIMRSHWIDTASRNDLNKLGELYDIKRKDNEQDPDYRYRLKTAIISHKGGGTIGTINVLVNIILKLPQDYSLQIVENPPIRLKRKWKVNAGHEWIVNPRNIYDTVPDIIVEVLTENVKITDPTITNITTGETITFKGNITHGDVLKISNGRATINGNDQTHRLSTTNIPKLPRKKSKWRYTEYIGSNMGVFDSTQFDIAVFAVDIVSNVTFEWTANQPATFQLHIPKELLVKVGITERYVQDIIDSVKACGVKAEVKVVE